MTLCPNCGLALEKGTRFCSSCGTKIGDMSEVGGGLIGSTFNGKYRVLSELGSGAVGTVYLGEHLSLKKQVALKVLHADLQIGEEALVRFQREGIAAGRFNHPGAIQIFDFDVEGENTWYLAMEYVEGETLKQYIRDHGPLETEEALDLLEQILSVLAESHRQGIIHRDLKPENIMVSTSAAGEAVIKVLDFGLSKLLDRGPQASMMTQTGRIMGTPMYMSPEQCAGREVDDRTDLYAAGLILYEMLSGTPPFEADSLTELLIKQTSEEAPSLIDSNPDSSFPVGVEEVLEIALAKDPEDRYESAGEMLEAVEDIDMEKIGRPLKRRSVQRTGRGRSKRRSGRQASDSRSPWLLVGGAAVVLALAGLGFVFMGNGSRSEHPRLSMHAAVDLSEEEQRYLALLDATRSTLRKRDSDQALESIGDAIAMACVDSEAYVLRGQVFASRGDLDTAGADYRQALALDPQYALAYGYLGWIAVQAGDRATAIENFEQAQTIDSKSTVAMAGEGALQFQQGEYRAAQELLSRAVEADPETLLAQQYLGRALLALNELDGAIAAFVEAKRQDSGAWQGPAGLGEAYLGKGRHEEAERQLREAVELAPEVLEPRLQLATVLVDLGRFDDADREIGAGLERRPDNARLHILRGIVLQQRGSSAEAIEQLTRGIELGEDGFEARLLCGALLQADGQPELALPHLLAAVELKESSVEAHTDYGLALCSLERYADAANELERACELNSESLFLHLSLGAIYSDFLGDSPRGLEHLKSYLEQGGDDERVKQRVARLER